MGPLYIARGVVSDPDDNMEALIVHWFLGDEEKPRECPQGVRPDEDGITQCDVSFPRDKPPIRLRVQDDEGNIYEDGVSVEVVDASAPTATITSPRPARSSGRPTSSTSRALSPTVRTSPRH